MIVTKTRNAIFFTAGTLMLLSVGLSGFNRRWLWIGGLTGAALLQAGITGFCRLGYLLEKHGVTKPDYGHYEEEKLKNIHKFKLIKKIRKVRKEISDQIKKAEA